MAESDALVSKEHGLEAVSNGLTNGVSNGTSNGHSESSSKHKEKDRDRERHKSSHKDRDRDRDRHSSSHKSSHKDRDKEKDKQKSSSSSSSGDKHKSSSDKDKERSSDKEKDKHKSSSSSSDKDRNRDKDKHKSSSNSDRDRNKDKERSDKERSKDKERSDKDRHKSSSDKDRDRDKHRDDKKHSSSSSGDKKDRDKNKSRDKDKEKDRHSSKSSHKDRHRDKDRHHDKDKDRHSEKDKEADTVQVKAEPDSFQDSTLLETSQDSTDGRTFNNTTQSSSNEQRGEGSAESEEDNKLVIEEPVYVKEELARVKEEPESADTHQKIRHVNYKEESDEDDDVPLASRSNKTKKESDEDYEESGGDSDGPLAAHKKLKKEDSDDDDLPLSARKRAKTEPDDSDDDDVPLAARKKPKKEAESDDDVPLSARKKPTKKKRKPSSGDEEDDFKPKAKKAKVKKATPASRRASGGDTLPKSPNKKVKKESEEEKNVWKWWEEEKCVDGRKWTFLDHKGVVFADNYERLPPNILMKYDGKPIVLHPDTEEVAGFYARMLDHDYVTKEQFNKNFFKDFRKVMTSEEREKITDLRKCDFSKMHTYYLQKNEERKARTKEEKKALKDKNDELVKEFGWCLIDGHKQRIANFKAEPPGLFRGRGDHPKMGMLKKRIMPEDVIINCSKDSNIPKAPDGHKWKEVRHDNTVTWLASWTENVQGQTKYVMMNAASKLKGEKDWQKYETARNLHQVVDRIRDQYRIDWKSKEMRIRQRSVALYFIDKLALRAGNEKDEDQADTVGCCSLRVEHITLHEEKDRKECVVAFDFLGKDSIRYYNEVPVEKRVFKNLKLFMENKAPGDDLFDRLNTQIMNKHLNELMEGLTAKVFRTYNASRTLQEQLDKLTDPDDDIANKVLSYNRANREVAILCNHQRSVPKTFDQSMANLQKKIDDKKELIEEAEKELKMLKRNAKSGGSGPERTVFEKKKKHVERLNEQLHKLEIAATDKEENKQIALGTSKLNYLDPRISVAWCKKHNVPIEKVYNKTQRLKFQWAIEMATEIYNFMEPPKSKFKPLNNSVNDDEEEEMEEEDDYS